MSNKNFAVSIIVVLASIATCIAFLMFVSVLLDGINAPAAIAAVTIAVIGVAWLKKTLVKQ